MKSKIFSMFLITALLSLALVSAVDFTFDPSIDSNTFNTGLENIDASLTTLSIQYPDGAEMPFTIYYNGGNVTINTTNIDYSELILGSSYTGNLFVSNTTDNKTYEIEVKSTYCTEGCNDEYLELDVDFKNKGIGEEDTEWYPFDEIEVEITVDNIYDEDIDDIVVEWCLYNPDKGKCTDIEEEENDFNLKDGKDKTITLNLVINPEDISDKTEDYIFYAKAYSDDKDYGEDTSCVEFSEDIKIMRDNFMILNNVIIPTSVPCDEILQISGEVWNIGDDEEEDVSMRIYNKDLGLNEIIELGDIDEFDSTDFEFEYKLPKELKEKLYVLEFRIFDEDGDMYENDNDDESIYLYQFKVEGNCKKEETKAQINAELDSETPEAIAGKQVIIKTTIKNTGDIETDYSLSVSGNSVWSNIVSIEPSSMTLAPGLSKEVKIILLIDEQAEGEKEFTIKATHGEQTTEQKIALSIIKKDSKLDKILEHLKINWFIYVIVIINLILIIAIISVVRRILSSSRTTM